MPISRGQLYIIKIISYQKLSERVVLMHYDVDNNARPHIYLEKIRIVSLQNENTHCKQR
jgi:hypothetical protein